MFYYVSKFAWFFASPSNLLVSLILLGLALACLRRFSRIGLGLAGAAALATLAFGLLPLANYIIVPLEARFPRFTDDGGPVTGIVLLGGSVEAEDSVNRGALTVNESAERVLGTLQLAHRYPEARILISGGGGTVFGDGTAEAPVTSAFMKSVGVDPGRILTEERSRTTYENAVFSAQMVKPGPGERWLLVTSAWHMPRAVGVFEKAGFPVTPYPVDYRAGPDFSPQRPFSFISDGLRRLDVGVKEWAGLVAYYLAGHSTSILPGPRASPQASSQASGAGGSASL